MTTTARALEIAAQEIATAIPGTIVEPPEPGDGRYFASDIRTERRGGYLGALADRDAIELELLEDLGRGRTAELGWTTIPATLSEDDIRYAVRSFIEESSR